MSIEFIILISTTSLSTIAIIIAILTLHQNQSKKLDALKDEVTNVKIEMGGLKAEVSILKSEISVLSKLFSRFETDITEVKQTVDTVKEQVETENRNLMDKVLDVLTPKTTVLQK